MNKGNCTKKRPCAGMAYALNRPERRDRTGIEFATSINLKTGKCSPLGYLYRRTSKDPGIVLNRCPWCDADFSALWPANRARAAADTKETTQ